MAFKDSCFVVCHIIGLCMFLVSISLFIFWLIFFPQELKFTVTDTSLTKFEYFPAPNNTLYYNLAINITDRNPNKRIGIYFRRVQVISHYRKKRFSLVTLNSTVPFYQGHKNTTVLAVNIQGQQSLLFKEKDMKQYNSETSLGIYKINVKLAIRVRIRYGKFKSEYYKPPKIDCKLKIPLTSSNGFRFKPTRCVNVDLFKSPH